MQEIINQPQAALLEVLSKCDTDKSSLIKHSGIFKHIFMVAMPDLRERYLVETYQAHRKCALLYRITMAGQRALKDHIKHKEVLANEPEKALPNRRNLFDFEVYVPPKSPYVRNNGNADYKSLGACA